MELMNELSKLTYTTRCFSSALGKLVALIVCYLMLFSNVSASESKTVFATVTPPEPSNSFTKQKIQTLTFGIVPQQSAAMLVRAWSPLLKQLSQYANIDVRFATAPDIPTFENRLAKGEYDIAYMNPYHYVVFHDAVGYQALAKEADKQLQGLIVVRKGGHIQDLRELDNKVIAFPAPAAFAATVLPRAHFNQLGVINEIKYVGSHDSVYIAVAKGMVDAGGGVGRTFNNMPENIKKQLRVLWRTPKYTPHAIATLPSVSDDIRQRLLGAMQSLSETVNGQKALDNLNFKNLVSANNRDWDSVRDLNLGSLAQPLKE